VVHVESHLPAAESIGGTSHAHRNGALSCPPVGGFRTRAEASSVSKFHPSPLYDNRPTVLVEYVIEAADPRDPLVMALNMERLVWLMRGVPIADPVVAAA